ncbi:glutathione S-transferase family protein [Litoreibacter arenae]|uniref:Glutathione S-transferase family protein n=1 Tax=Litoreibacter arenae DSM 19593 TaxID=1123360 RepID=S9QK84_9RHOB|nr:glutathione S-transferase family protein [Litoreibacter arenae]EPX80182.1 Glutathione S-transferase family protein [Litoreibacter arenae DSM 19593]
MYEIFSVDHSLYCAKLRLALRTKGLEWRDLAPPADYLSLVPTGNLPALKDGNLTLTDSEAIAEYLEEKHPDSAMLPKGLIPRAKCRELSRFHDTRLEPALRLLFSNVSPATRVASETEAAHAEITKRLTALSTLLDQSPLPRDRLWLGDCGLIVTLEWLDLMEQHSVLRPLHWSPTVRSYRAQMQALPQVAQELASYRPHMQDWMDGKLRENHSDNTIVAIEK